MPSIFLRRLGAFVFGVGSVAVIGFVKTDDPDQEDT